MADDHDADDKPVDTDDTGEDNRDNALHHKLGLHDTHAGDTHRALGSAVGRAEHGEDDGGGDAHGAEEGGVGRAELCHLSGEEKRKKEHFLYVLCWCFCVSLLKL